MVDETQAIDLGNSWDLSPISQNGRHIGYLISGPAAPQCPYPNDGRCGGLVRTVDTGDGKPVWTVEQEDPLTLSPSIKCGCEGQHGHVQEGRYVA
jgi:hypothetical protein